MTEADEGELEFLRGEVKMWRAMYADHGEQTLGGLMARVKQFTWLPIDTAPKGGDDILALFDPGDGETPLVDMVYWDEDTWIISAEGGARFSRPQSCYTRWMPVPAPPNTSSPKV